MSQSIIERLDRLAEFHDLRDLLVLDKQQMIDRIITPELKKQVADIEAEFSNREAAAIETISALEEEIKRSVLSEGESVKGLRLQAVWSKGRVSWDDKALTGYAKAHPEINDLRKQGEPSVSIRTNK